MSFPDFQIRDIHKVSDELTLSRLGRYLRATRNNRGQALRLYVLNARVSAVLMTDLHYVEILLRNRFDRELTARFGATWYNSPQFLSLVNGRTHGILQKAQKNAAKHWKHPTPLLPGKVIAELTFGFWLSLTDRQLEHSLWTPCLHRAFHPRRPPKRATFNQQLEKLRHLRNRIAHHEPIFHLDLIHAHQRISEVNSLFCYTTTRMMNSTSKVKRNIMSIVKYRERNDI